VVLVTLASTFAVAAWQAAWQSERVASSIAHQQYYPDYYQDPGSVSFHRLFLAFLRLSGVLKLDFAKNGQGRQTGTPFPLFSFNCSTYSAEAHFTVEDPDGAGGLESAGQREGDPTWGRRRSWASNPPARRGIFAATANRRIRSFPRLPRSGICAGSQIWAVGEGDSRISPSTQPSACHR
jgi:hypothetical protein